jgi:cation diffusion facilitator CzcD-associated flavoprotein CzcO
LHRQIRYRYRVTAASWSSADRWWTVEVTREDTGQVLRFTAVLLWMCQGYPRLALPAALGGHSLVPGRNRAPAELTRDLDHTGMCVVVIGSDASAATLHIGK